jgi:hypothetical protein
MRSQHMVLPKSSGKGEKSRVLYGVGLLVWFHSGCCMADLLFEHQCASSSRSPPGARFVLIF